MDEEGKLATETLAELYLKGDNIEKAYQIYQELLKKSPNSSRFREKVKELELRLIDSGRGLQGRGESLPRERRDIERAIGELKGWLNRIQRARKKSM